MTVVVALPKGRILEEAAPLLAKAGIHPEPAFFADESRQLRFACLEPGIEIIRVRSFDVATFVAYGAAQLGIAGSDVLEEFDYPDLYAPLDLNIGRCRLSVAQPAGAVRDLSRLSHVRVATKYPGLTRRFFAERGIQAECIKLSGAMELAPSLGLSPLIMDLVSSGKTLAANGLEEVETVMQVSSRLVVNRAAFKTRSAELGGLIDQFRKAVRNA